MPVVYGAMTIPHGSYVGSITSDSLELSSVYTCAPMFYSCKHKALKSIVFSLISTTMLWPKNEVTGNI